MKLLRTQRRISANILKCSKKKITFNPEALEDIKEAITAEDIKELIKDDTISKKQKKGVSRGRTRKREQQQRKGRRKGDATHKGTRSARLSPKTKWINAVRAQRRLVRELKQKNILPEKTYREVYAKIKGGFFRSRRHIKLYLQEHGLTK